MVTVALAPCWGFDMIRLYFPLWEPLTPRALFDMGRALPVCTSMKCELLRGLMPRVVTTSAEVESVVEVENVVDAESVAET